MPVRRALLLACCVVAHALVAAVVPAAAQTAGPPGPIEYRPPVDAPVVDPFRPPATRYGPGNRGVDLATREGEPVGASAPGEVVFAGPVAGTLHVVVLHADGLRTSYSFLRTVDVRAGARVDTGDRVGTAGAVLHVGVRAGDAYLDPAALWGDGFEVRLVPLEDRPALDEARRALADRLLDGRDGPGPARRLVSAAIGWARRGADAAADYVRAEVSSLAEELLTWAHYAVELRPTTHLLRLGEAAWQWWRRRDDCTPAGVDPPPPTERRIAVLVAGLGSTSESAAVDDVDTGGLGYDADDVLRFSYAGGRVPGTGASLPGLAESRYRADDSARDLQDAGARLAALVADVRRAAPGVPIDVIAHSQGGVVARLAIDGPADLGGGALVTLGSPHRGSDLATGVAQARRTEVGDLALTGLAAVAPGPDPGSVAVAQLSETSSLVRDLARRPAPTVSIAARGDLVVAAGRSEVAGGTTAVVDLAGPSAHDELPGSAAAHREMALALAGMDPTCESFLDAMADAALADLIGWQEDALGATVGLLTRRVDGRIPGTHRPPTRTPGQPGQP